jgi:hypothetical protein
MGFIKDTDYTNSVFPLENFKKQLKRYLNRRHGIPEDKLDDKVKEVLEASGVKDPEVVYVDRDLDTLDKDYATTSLMTYINNVHTENEYLTPAFTTYTRKIGPSMQAEFIQEGLTLRKEHKGAAKKYDSIGDKLRYRTHDTLQKTFKLRNNALSGASLSPSTIFNNPSMHFSLTSGTRTLASIGNLVSEMMVKGRRAYIDPEVVINHAYATAESTNTRQVRDALDKYKLKIPTTDDLMGIVEYNTRDFWISKSKLDSIKEALSSLTPEEKTAFAYTNDLYHMRKFNYDIVHTMLKELSMIVYGEDEDIEYVKNTDEFIVNIAHHICFSTLAGEGLDYSKFPAKARRELTGTVKHLVKVLEHYQLLIDAFFHTDVIPVNIAYVQDLPMYAIALSDTDSTCASYDNWIETGMENEHAVGYAATVLMFNSGLVNHYLRQIGANFNTDKEKQVFIGMKNEYFWRSFAGPGISKHYFADIKIKEGLVYDDPRMEVKGVNLIASTVPKEFRDRFTEMITDITNELYENNVISAKKYISGVVEIEKEIIERIARADDTLIKSMTINAPSGYKRAEDDANIKDYHFYNAVFEEKYGKTDTLPILCKKLLIRQDIPLHDMVDNIKDTTIREKWKQWLVTHPKKEITQIRFPHNILSIKGIPDELFPMLDKKRFVTDNLGQFYMALSAIGVDIKPGYILTEQGY